MYLLSYVYKVCLISAFALMKLKSGRNSIRLGHQAALGMATLTPWRLTGPFLNPPSSSQVHTSHAKA